jgi:hypothetical protein
VAHADAGACARADSATHSIAGAPQARIIIESLCMHLPRHSDSIMYISTWKRALIMITS